MSDRMFSVSAARFVDDDPLDCVPCLFYSRAQAAQRAGFSLAHLDRQVALGGVPSKKVGRRRLFPREAFDQWCNRLDGSHSVRMIGMIGG